MLNNVTPRSSIRGRSAQAGILKLKRGLQKKIAEGRGKGRNDEGETIGASRGGGWY